jgi:release factor glutamine methyltransferase
MPTIAQAIQQVIQTLSSSTPLLDAEVLLAHVLGVQRAYLYTYPEQILSEEEQSYFDNLIEKRAQGWPIAYLTGHCEFWSLDLIVTPDTLIPRPETELLIDLALKKPSDLPLVIADLGTGSGAIALALAHERPGWTIYATDSSQPALNVAKMNAAQLGIKNIIFCYGDWYNALPLLDFDIIISNPPYIAENDPYLQPAVLATEPISALLAGEDGLKDIRHIIPEARNHLKPGGYLMLEHGFSQADAVRDLFLTHGYTQVTSYQDFSGLNRVTTGVFGIECSS